jgi:peptidoglycan/LPS O-acetylase OafA/YrhL
MASTVPLGTADSGPARSAAADSRVSSVDGLRGIAILLVMLSHFVRAPQSGVLLDRLFWSVASVGWCGVDLFFVLSGFLITGILLDGIEAGSSPRNFYARRILRVVPVY